MEFIDDIINLRSCSVCGRDEDDVEWLVDFTVIVADGEEGFAQITQWICETHFDSMVNQLMELGFKDHRHGGINFLEDQDCVGYDGCPTPTEYGPVTVTVDGPKQY